MYLAIHYLLIQLERINNMTNTGYIALKNHFDRVFKSGHPGNGLEQIRDTYFYAFNKFLGQYSIYQTPIRLANNPVNTLVTLIGPQSDNIPVGIVPCLNTINSVSCFSNEYFLSIDSSNISKYIDDIIQSMESTMSADSLYNCDPSVGPYIKFLKTLPMYLTYHHVKGINSELVNSQKSQFCEWMLKHMICKSEKDAESIFDSISENKFVSTFEKIYKVITCENTISLFN